MRKHNRRILLLLALLLCGAAVWGVRRAWPPPIYNLLERATKVADVRDDRSYYWLSHDELLVKSSNSSHTPWSGNLDMIDVRARTRTPLEGLTAAIMQHRTHYDYDGPWSFERSPNGQYIIWICRDPADGGIHPSTAHLDGAEYHEWPSIADYDAPQWIDGHRWYNYVETAHTKYLTVHDVTQPHADRKLLYNSSEAQSLESLATRYSGQDQQSIMLSAEPAHDITANVVFDIVMRPAGVVTDTPPKRIDTITFPPGTEIHAYMLNPQMTCLLFMDMETDIPPYAPLLHRIIPSYSYPAHPILRLCIYHIDKKELSEVGRIDNPSALLPSLSMWASDGKRFCFFYNSALYTVPVD
ncbi:MAG TPA: hypothetical protein VKU00_01190 [Chthonomonadaceae bacterium]|nr:hypothetical protein [Chthonomonadaceae bacterium]